ncbi:cell division protein FtsQ/DivIB [Sinobaca sp. H24]|uniref:cell division protein FtsQ/DivIB n=1 Tax=Sinobaca sp. H24 TaxID=2923376 RepID=UPI00207A68EB|nr:FtsQ-type POTRA domain-containing protein [Sinobaca sp. H24]
MKKRIPTLQEQRRKRSNRRFVIYLSIFLILIGLVIYFQSPLSNIRAVEVEGNQIAEKNVIIETSGIVTGENIWSIDRGSAEAEIEELEEVQEASISRSLPGRVVIDITEQERVGYVISEGTFIPVLTTGAVLRNKPSEQIPSDAPLLHGFSDEEKLERFSKEMSNAGDGIRNSISEVIFSPTEEDPNELKLFMNDGIEVESTIPGFAEHMASYPSVSAEVDRSVRVFFI